MKLRNTTMIALASAALLAVSAVGVAAQDGEADPLAAAFVVHEGTDSKKDKKAIRELERRYDCQGSNYFPAVETEPAARSGAVAGSRRAIPV